MGRGALRRVIILVWRIESPVEFFFLFSFEGYLLVMDMLYVKMILLFYSIWFGWGSLVGPLICLSVLLFFLSFLPSGTIFYYLVNYDTG